MKLVAGRTLDRVISEAADDRRARRARAARHRGRRRARVRAQRARDPSRSQAVERDRRRVRRDRRDRLGTREEPGDRRARRRRRREPDDPDPTTRRRWPARCSARRRTCRPSRRAASGSTSTPTSTRSARSSITCSRASARSPEVTDLAELIECVAHRAPRGSPSSRPGCAGRAGRDRREGDGARPERPLSDRRRARRGPPPFQAGKLVGAHRYSRRAARAALDRASRAAVAVGQRRTARARGVGCDRRSPHHERARRGAASRRHRARQASRGGDRERARRSVDWPIRSRSSVARHSSTSCPNAHCHSSPHRPPHAATPTADRRRAGRAGARRLRRARRNRAAIADRDDVRWARCRRYSHGDRRQGWARDGVGPRHATDRWTVDAGVEIAIAPDGSQFLASSLDGTLSLRSVDDGQVIETWKAEPPAERAGDSGVGARQQTLRALGRHGHIAIGAARTSGARRCRRAPRRRLRPRLLAG